MKQYTTIVSKIKKALAIAIALFVMLRLYIVIVLNQEDDYMYITCQTVFTISWAAVAWFMYYCSLMMYQNAFTKKENMRMSYVSLFAMLACIVRVVVFAVYKWPIVSYDVAENVFYMWPSIHNVMEEVIWLMLAFFFYSYYMVRRSSKIAYNKAKQESKKG